LLEPHSNFAVFHLLVCEQPSLHEDYETPLQYSNILAPHISNQLSNTIPDLNWYSLTLPSHTIAFAILGLSRSVLTLFIVQLTARSH